MRKFNSNYVGFLLSVNIKNCTKTEWIIHNGYSSIFLVATKRSPKAEQVVLMHDLKL